MQAFCLSPLLNACVPVHAGSRPVILTMGIFMLINLIAGCMIADIPGGGDPLTDPSAYKTLRSPVPSAPGGKPLPTPVPALSPLPDRLRWALLPSHPHVLLIKTPAQWQ